MPPTALRPARRCGPARAVPRASSLCRGAGGRRPAAQRVCAGVRARGAGRQRRMWRSGGSQFDASSRHRHWACSGGGGSSSGSGRGAAAAAAAAAGAGTGSVEAASRASRSAHERRIADRTSCAHSLASGPAERAAAGYGGTGVRVSCQGHLCRLWIGRCWAPRDCIPDACSASYAQVEMFTTLWMWRQEYQHHEQLPLAFNGTWPSWNSDLDNRPW